MLMLFTAGNLLPPQVIITPLFRMYLLLPLPPPLSDNGVCCTTSTSGSSLIHIAFQLGFCTFVLSNYMKTIPRELNEAALVDGASVWTTYRQGHPAAASRRWPRSRRSRSRSSTTTSSGPSCS